MTRDLEWLNALTADQAVTELLQCCGSKRWAEAMTARRPYATIETLLAAATDVWASLETSDWLQAFRSHPRIGERKAAASVSEQSQQWSGQEQAGVTEASQQTVESLASLNQLYERKFGFIFIICATGKSSAEMLEALRERIESDPTAELPLAAAEQAKITHLRLKKLVNQS
jgi:allantoicase